jgi:hypothetical protein
VTLLDLDEVYFNLTARYADLALLISTIENFLFPLSA